MKINIAQHLVPGESCFFLRILKNIEEMFPCYWLIMNTRMDIVTTTIHILRVNSLHMVIVLTTYMLLFRQLVSVHRKHFFRIIFENMGNFRISKT